MCTKRIDFTIFEWISGWDLFWVAGFIWIYEFGPSAGRFAMVNLDLLSGEADDF